MISMSSIGSAGGAAKYMTEHGATEYYAGEKVPSQWQGQGAEIQGLVGREVTTGELTKQLEGKVQQLDKTTGEWQEKQLGRIIDGKIEHRAGWDMTFAAPKSVSIESEVFNRIGVREAHEAAVLKAMEFLQDKAAQTRVKGEMVNSGNMTYATFSHATSRAGDPQTHTHVVIANVTYVDGKAYSLSNEKLMEWRTTADQVYKNELAHALEKDGLRVQWDKQGNFEIVGYSKDQLDVFSKRNEEIKGALADRNMDKDTASHAARQAAALDTRHDKDHPENAEAHREKWMAEAAAAGIKQAERFDNSTQHLQTMQSARDSVQAAMNHLTEREMAFSEKDLWKETARFSQGDTDLDKLYKAVQEQVKDGNLIHREDGKFTTREAIAAEKWMSDHLSKGYGAHEATMTNKEFESALAKFEALKSSQLGIDFKLNEGQREAARMVLTSDDKYMGIQGLAGTGKTTLFEFVREAVEGKGGQIIGISNGGAQADKLQADSGIKSSTCEKFLIESEKMIRDAVLAQRALATQEKHSGVFGKEPNFKDLASGVKNDSVKVEYDSNRRAYYTDNHGDTWAKSLYEKVTQTSSANLNHLGLTDTKYVVTDKGVFKSGGSVASEIAGHQKDKLNEGPKPDTFLGKVDNWVADKWLTNAQDWQKCNVVEATAVRAQCALETSSNHQAELSALKTQAASVDGSAKNVTLVMDEASMAGQKEFNRVVEVADKLGYKVTFSGDENQHQAVAAGKAYELAQDHMSMSYLTDIQRQTTHSMKETVATIVDGKHEDATRGLPTKETNTNQQAVAKKWGGRENLSRTEKTQMAAEKKEALVADNQLVITGLAKSYTDMPKESRKVDVDLKDKVEGKDYSVVRNDQGTPERITFHKDDQALGIKAGESGTIPAGGIKDDIANVKMDSQNNTIIITATNADRQAINAEIRDLLKDKGQLPEGTKLDTLRPAGNTAEEMKVATTFEKGQVVEFTSAYKSLDLDKGERGVVTGMDSRTNTVDLKMEDGRDIKFDPEKIKGKDLYTEVKDKEFAVGDRVAIGKNGKDAERADVKNGRIGTVEKIDEKNLTLKMENGEKREFNTAEYKHIDHAYAVTSYKSQGQSVDVAKVHHNTESGQHGDREAYVNETRAKTYTEVHTQNADKAATQSGQKMDKEQATPVKDENKELVKESQSAKPEQGKDHKSVEQPQAKGVDAGKPEPTQSKSNGQIKDADTGKTDGKPDQSKANVPGKPEQAEPKQNKDAKSSNKGASTTSKDKSPDSKSEKAPGAGKSSGRDDGMGR